MLEVIQIPIMSDNYIYLLHNSEDQLTAAIDPGLAEPVLKELEKKSWKLDYIFNTHHHYDHTDGNKELVKKTGCKIYGFEGDKNRIPSITNPLKNQDVIPFGSFNIEVIYTPGHTLGHICYYIEKENILFSGDTLFAMGCGRMFEGNPKQMLESLKKLKVLPHETTVYCAHEYTQSNGFFAFSLDQLNEKLIQRLYEVKGLREKNLPTIPTTIQKELDTNPFFRTENSKIIESLDLTGKEEWEVFKAIRLAKDQFRG